MTQLIHRMPTLDLHHKVSRPARVVHKPLTGGKPKMSNAEVAAYVLRHMKGKSINDLAREANVANAVMRQWCLGENRKAAYFEALAQYERWMREHAPG